MVIGYIEEMIRGEVRAEAGRKVGRARSNIHGRNVVSVQDRHFQHHGQRNKHIPHHLCRCPTLESS